MATQQTPLYEFRNGVDKVLMGVEWDDITLQVGSFVFRIDLGNRGATFTLTRVSTGTVRIHDFTPETARRWDPPFPMAMSLFVNPKTGLTVGLPVDWTAEMGLD